jgi:thiamine pyrophosphate-dependent acetolactate synthase large subunit-like protein
VKGGQKCEGGGGGSLALRLAGKLAAPGRLVVCSIGDGAVMYSAAVFWTQVRYGIPVLTVVWNNHKPGGATRLPSLRRKDGHYASLRACTSAIQISTS